MQIRIVNALVADRCGGPVSWKDRCRRVQSEKLFADALKKQRAVTAGQIPSPDSATEQHIAPDQVPRPGKEKTNAPGAVAWNVQDPHFNPRHLALVTFLKEAVGRKWLDLQFEPVTAEKSGVGHHGGRVRVIGNPAAMPPLDPGRIGGMIEMPVRQQKPIHLVPCKPGVGTLRGVKKDVSPGGFQKKSVGIKGAAGKCFELIHLGMV